MPLSWLKYLMRLTCCMLVLPLVAAADPINFVRVANITQSFYDSIATTEEQAVFSGALNDLSIVGHQLWHGFVYRFHLEQQYGELNYSGFSVYHLPHYDWQIPFKPVVDHYTQQHVEVTVGKWLQLANNISVAPLIGLSFETTKQTLPINSTKEQQCLQHNAIPLGLELAFGPKFYFSWLRNLPFKHSKTTSINQHISIGHEQWRSERVALGLKQQNNPKSSALCQLAWQHQLSSYAADHFGLSAWDQDSIRHDGHHVEIACQWLTSQLF